MAIARRMPVERKHKRKSLSYPAWIDFKGNPNPIRCRLEDASEGGAKLAVANAGSIPEQFLLRLSLTCPYGKPCVVRWRLSDCLGVQFK